MGPLGQAPELGVPFLHSLFRFQPPIGSRGIPGQRSASEMNVVRGPAQDPGQHPGKAQWEPAPQSSPPPGPEAARHFQKSNLALISLCASMSTQVRCRSLPPVPLGHRRQGEAVLRGTDSPRSSLFHGRILSASQVTMTLQHNPHRAECRLVCRRQYLSPSPNPAALCGVTGQHVTMASRATAWRRLPESRSPPGSLLALSQAWEVGGYC